MMMGKKNKQKVLEKQEKVSAPYLAGLIDGEGYIGIVKCGGGEIKEKYRLGYSLIPTICLTMTKADELLKEISEMFDAYYKKHRTNRHNCKPQTQISIPARSIKRFLLYILPHLRLKKKQAELLLEFLKYRKKISQYDNTKLEKQIEIYNKLKFLNLQGLGKPKGLLSVDQIRDFRPKKKKFLELLVPDELRELYWERDLTQLEIAKLKGCPHWAVKTYMNKYYKIPGRSSSECAKKRERDKLIRTINLKTQGNLSPNCSRITEKTWE